MEMGEVSSMPKRVTRIELRGDYCRTITVSNLSPEDCIDWIVSVMGDTNVDVKSSPTVKPIRIYVKCYEAMANMKRGYKTTTLYNVTPDYVYDCLINALT